MSQNVNIVEKPFMVNTQRVGFGDRLFIDGRDIGRLFAVWPDRIVVEDKQHITTSYKIGNSDFALITTYPTRIK